jgi:DNA-binding MarR family transcriptional regulator/N-acetylglutamate synthase-like GNAT family acetyltransferase
MPALADSTAAVRRFNRFYTRQIGLLDEALLHSPYSLTEVRVLYEIAHRPGLTATELRELLVLDAGYLSRILRGLGRQGLVSARAAAADRRRRRLMLTERGRRTFARLDARSSEEVAAMLARLSGSERRELVLAMRGIEGLLGRPAQSEAPSVSPILRDPRPGELGWVVKRHGELYAAEYGWNAEFEGLVAGIVARFVAELDPRVERCWIAELEGEPAGSIFLVKDTDRVAKLRLLLVEPWARGKGVGGRLVDACVGFARESRYAKVRLWTNSVLQDARRLYQRAGFRLVEENPHHSFGHDLVSQTWELDLT